MVAWSRRTGVKLAESLPLQYDDGFNWVLPNGEHILADWRRCATQQTS
jgi:hypothetical protein